MIEASVLIVGAGAIGGVTAAKMESRVRRVSVLDANEEHVERLRDPGLLLDELGEERHVQVEAHADAAELDEEFDFALLTLKAPYLEAALGPLHERGVAKAFVSLGNGLVQDSIAGLVGEENLIVGSVRDRTRLLASILETMGEVRVTDNIRGQVWSKLLVNSTFSGLGVVSGLLYREIAENPSGREAAYALWREGYDVGQAEALDLAEVLGVPAETLVVRGPEDRQSADE